jgi:hypothetical protein
MRVTSLAGHTMDGVTEARWGQAEVLVKTNRIHPNVVVNEYIANRLAVILGVPVPLGDLSFDGDNEPQWVVAAVRDRGIDLPPPSAAILRRVPEPTRAKMVCFDALIQNDDRTDENILVGSSGEAWLIDHDQSLFTDRRDRAPFLNARRDQRWLDSGRLWRLAPPSTDHVLAAATRMASMNIEAVEEILGHLRNHSLIEKIEQDAVIDFIHHRRDNIHRLVDRMAVEEGAVRYGDASGAEAPSEGGENA